MQPEAQSMSPTGIIKIINMFRLPTAPTEPVTFKFIEDISKSLKEVSDVNIVNKFINCFYLVAALEKSFMGSECQCTVGDKKVIHVILVAYRIVLLDTLLYNASLSLKKEQAAPLIKIRDENLGLMLKVERVSNLDLEHLKLLQDIKENDKFREFYVRIQQNAIKRDEVHMDNIEVFKMLSWLISVSFESLSKISGTLTTRLLLAYLACSLKFKTKLPVKEIKESKLMYLYIGEGFKIIEYYINNLSIDGSKEDLEFCIKVLAMDPSEGLARRMDTISEEEGEVSLLSSRRL